MSKSKVIHQGLVKERNRLRDCLHAVDDFLIDNFLTAETPEQYREALHDAITISIAMELDPGVNDSAPLAKPMQSAVAGWVIEAFGPKAMKPVERGRRVIEEGIEYGRAVGVPRDEMLHIANSVYRDPPGDPFQKLGGVATTLLAAAESIGADLADAANTELRRVKAKGLDAMRKRQEDKANRGMSS